MCRITHQRAELAQDSPHPRNLTPNGPLGPQNSTWVKKMFKFGAN